MISKTTTQSDFSSRDLTGNDGTGVTLLFNGMTWKHDRLFEGLFASMGYKGKRLPTPDVQAFQLGKEFGNNGQCNPTYFTVGNLVKYLQDLEAQGWSREEITNQYAFITFGANGPCRFGMYVEEYRLALRNAGFPDFRIEMVDRDGGLNQESGNGSLFDPDMDFIFGLLNSFSMGDVITSIGYQIRPFEVNPGETDKAIDECMDYLYEFMKNRTPYELNGATRFLKNRWPKFYGGLNYLAKFRHLWIDDGPIKAFEHCRNCFNTIKVDRTRVKPIVKVIGEFWAQTTEGDGNFRMFSFLENEGAQCIVEPVSTWIPYLLHLAEERTKESLLAEGHSTDSVLQNLKRGTRQRLNYWLDLAQLKLATKIFLREYGRLARLFGDLPTYLIDQQELARLGGTHYNPLADGGEGHLEIAKSIYYTSRHKAHMMLSLKPFGCMPSTQSDGAMAGVVSKYKEMIFLPIETSGEGEINAHSRVQMALGEAKHKTKAEFTQTLEKTGYRLEQIRRYVADHPELETPMYAVPRHPGVVGTAANFVQHVANRMKKDGISGEVTS